MQRDKTQQLATAVRGLEPQVILRVAGLCDGHTIFKEQAFLEAGLPANVVEHLTRTYRSDGSPKGTIFVDGRAVPKRRGVYGLDVLRFLASSLGVEYRRALGRGSEAQNIQAAVKQHFNTDALPRPT